MAVESRNTCSVCASCRKGGGGDGGEGLGVVGGGGGLGGEVRGVWECGDSCVWGCSLFTLLINIVHLVSGRGQEEKKGGCSMCTSQGPCTPPIKDH